jgi:mono/diheme cytochrome c family protein
MRRFGPATKTFAGALASLLVTLCAGCENGMKDMYRQPKYGPLAPAPLWSDGRAARPLEPDTVAHSAGTLAGSASGRRGLSEPDARTEALYTPAALARGRERFGIFCAPCHGASGDGDGYITRRGFPHPPTYHSDRLRAMPDSYLFGVITTGYGAMYPYADRIVPGDRWAIVAYIRALQLSQHSSVAALPQAEQAKLLASR